MEKALGEIYHDFLANTAVEYHHYRFVWVIDGCNGHISVKKTRKKSSKKNVFRTTVYHKSQAAFIPLRLLLKRFFMLFIRTQSDIVLLLRFKAKLNFSNCQKQCVKSSVFLVVFIFPKKWGDKKTWLLYFVTFVALPFVKIVLTLAVATFCL